MIRHAPTTATRYPWRVALLMKRSFFTTPTTYMDKLACIMGHRRWLMDHSCKERIKKKKENNEHYVTQGKSGKKGHMTKQKEPRLPNAAASLLSKCMKRPCWYKEEAAGSPIVSYRTLPWWPEYIGCCCHLYRCYQNQMTLRGVCVNLVYSKDQWMWKTCCMLHKQCYHKENRNPRNAGSFVYGQSESAN